MLSRHSSRRRRSLLMPTQSVDPSLMVDCAPETLPSASISIASSGLDAWDGLCQDDQPLLRMGRTSLSLSQEHSGQSAGLREQFRSLHHVGESSRELRETQCADEEGQRRDSISPVNPAKLLLPNLSAGPLELILRSPGLAATEEVQIRESSILIGRGSHCDLRLPHRDISRRHALLQRVGERLLIVDLGSRTGVYRNGQRITRDWVSAEDDIQLGPYSLSLPVHSETGVPDAVGVPASQLFARQKFEVEGIAGLGFRVYSSEGELVGHVPLERPITLAGRSPICKLRLHDQSVSQVHLGIMLSIEGIFAVDLVRRRGLILNGRAVSRARLSVGDRIGVGRYCLEVTCSPSRPASSAASSVSTVVEPVVSPVPVSSGVSESVVLSLISAMTDMQREFQAQSRFQMEFMQRLVETIRVDLRDEILGELRRLQEVTGEIQKAQQEVLSLSRAADAGSSPGNVIPTQMSPATSAKPERPGAPVAGATRRTSSVKGGGTSEHAWIAERIARLEQERARGWDRLLRLMGSAN